MNPKLTASLMIVAAVLANVGFIALGSIFNYPDVLDEPPGAVLASFRDARGRRQRMVLGPGAGGCAARPDRDRRRAALVDARDAHRGARRRSRRLSCRSSACCAGRSSCPATRPTRPARQPTSPQPPATRSRRRATSSARPSARRSAICSPRRGPRSWSSRSVVASPARWFVALGATSAALVFVGVFSPLDLPLIDTANFLGYVLWSVWLIAFAVVILVRERRAGRARSTPGRAAVTS